jgi:hypothetical protein
METTVMGRLENRLKNQVGEPGQRARSKNQVKEKFKMIL